ncbi:MAG: SPOR domain-containing protein [Bacteroidota bacterium]
MDRRTAPLILALGGWLLAGCGSLEETRSGEAASRAEILEHERSFRPSEAEPDPLSGLDTARGAHGGGREISPGARPAPDSILTPGFRVQVLTTTDIDRAQALQAALEGEFPEHWFYLSFDQPTYKLRAGDFAARYEADRFVQILKLRGHPDAWIVPDRIRRNPPPRPAPPPPEDIR